MAFQVIKFPRISGARDALSHTYGKCLVATRRGKECVRVCTKHLAFIATFVVVLPAFAGADNPWREIGSSSGGGEEIGWLFLATVAFFAGMKVLGVGWGKSMPWLAIPVAGLCFVLMAAMAIQFALVAVAAVPVCLIYKAFAKLNPGDSGPPPQIRCDQKGAKHVPTEADCTDALSIETKDREDKRRIAELRRKMDRFR